MGKTFVGGCTRKILVKRGKDERKMEEWERREEEGRRKYINTGWERLLLVAVP